MVRGPTYAEAKQAYLNAYKRWKRDETNVAKLKEYQGAKEAQRIAYRVDVEGRRRENVAQNEFRSANREKALARERRATERRRERMGAEAFEEYKQAHNKKQWQETKKARAERMASAEKEEATAR